MRILGIDPGLQIAGFGVIDVDGQSLTYVASGTIKTGHLETCDLPGRLKVLFDGVREIVERYQPDSASVEIVFVNVNPQATLLLGQARGACITSLVFCDLPVTEYSALQEGETRGTKRRERTEEEAQRKTKAVGGRPWRGEGAQRERPWR